jgi:hypothetical protein
MAFNETASGLPSAADDALSNLVRKAYVIATLKVKFLTRD